MILQALRDYATANDLASEPAFEHGRVAFALQYNADGDFKGVRRLVDAADAKRPQTLSTLKAAGNEAATTGRYIKWLTETASRTAFCMKAAMRSARSESPVASSEVSANGQAPASA